MLNQDQVKKEKKRGGDDVDVDLNRVKKCQELDLVEVIQT